MWVLGLVSVWKYADCVQMCVVFVLSERYTAVTIFQSFLYRGLSAEEVQCVTELLISKSVA